MKPAIKYGEGVLVQGKANTFTELVDIIQRTSLSYDRCTDEWASVLVYSEGDYDIFRVSDNAYTEDGDPKDDMFYTEELTVYSANPYQEHGIINSASVTATFIKPEYIQFVPGYEVTFPCYYSIYTSEDFDRLGDVESCIITLIPEDIKETFYGLDIDNYHTSGKDTEDRKFNEFQRLRYLPENKTLTYVQLIEKYPQLG
jgi:hypothetical protein